MRIVNNQQFTNLLRNTDKKKLKLQSFEGESQKQHKSSIQRRNEKKQEIRCRVMKKKMKPNRTKKNQQEPRTRPPTYLHKGPLPSPINVSPSLILHTTITSVRVCNLPANDGHRLASIAILSNLAAADLFRRLWHLV
jgi:hypothetical protein